MAKSTAKKTQTKKSVEVKGAINKSTAKVDSIIDAKVVETKAAVREQFKDIEVKVVIPEKVKKVEAEVAATVTKKESIKGKPKAEVNAKKNEKNGKNNKTTSKAKTKESVKVKAEPKTTNKVETKINYSELLGEEPIKVVITNEKKTGKNYPVKVALKNYGFLKTVKVKYTEDNWITPLEKELTFKAQDENNIEEWSTIIELNSKDKVNLEYVVSYEVNDQIYWDNNQGNNYIV